jgi:hypothetical protein
MNRAEGAERQRLLGLFLYVGGMILVLLMILEMELTSRPTMHWAHFYRVVATAVPLVLAVMARASRFRWAATAVTGIYTAFVMLIGWILPLFPAEPKLGPVYYPVTQFTPPEFPLLLIVPAFALDLVWQRTGNWNVWKQAVVSAAVFVAIFAAVQWPFADFLESPLARNWFFGTYYFGYNTNPNSRYARYLFALPEARNVFWEEWGMAFAIAAVLTRIGIACGDRMQRVRR